MSARRSAGSRMVLSSRPSLPCIGQRRSVLDLIDSPGGPAVEAGFREEDFLSRLFRTGRWFEEAVLKSRVLPDSARIPACRSRPRYFGSLLPKDSRSPG